MDRIKLETKHVSIEFPGVKALDDINFEVTTGEIRAVVGANGAGKSTLMKVLAGANSTYTGEVLLNGKKVEVRTPVDAKKLGIQIVYQEVDMALYPTLSVAENIVQNDMVMGKSGYIVNWKKAYKQGREALDRLHIGRDQVDEHELVQNLSLAQKQMVLIAKAIRSECNFLILDEPTAPLSNTETEELFRIVKHLHETENIAILFISHRLNEILEVCENYTVMRNGKMIDTTPVTGETTTKEIVEKMLGRKFEENFPKEACQIGDVLFQNETGFYRDWRLSDKINRFGMNKSIRFIVSFLEDGYSTEFLYTAATLDELKEHGFKVVAEQSYWRKFEKLGNLLVVPGTYRMAEYTVFMVYLVNEQGYIVWSFQPMGDYENLYALKGVACRDIDGDGMKDLAVLARYSYEGKDGETIQENDYSIYYQKTGGFYQETEFKKQYQSKDDSTMEELVEKARAYWGWRQES